MSSSGTPFEITDKSSGFLILANSLLLSRLLSVTTFILKIFTKNNVVCWMQYPIKPGIVE